jgi:hypothetical protein
MHLEFVKGKILSEANCTLGGLEKLPHRMYLSMSAEHVGSFACFAPARNATLHTTKNFQSSVLLCDLQRNIMAMVFKKSKNVLMRL